MSGKGGRQSCAMSANDSKGRVARNRLSDEGRPLGTGLQERAPNHLRRLWPKAMVVSAQRKGLALTGSRSDGAVGRVIASLGAWMKAHGHTLSVCR
jgi:hypothetical protein